jgi:DNA-binding NtrC family response regulator
MNLQEETLSQGQNKHSAKTILVIEDDASIGEMLIDALSDTSYQAFLVSDGQEALQVVHVIKPALFITDYRLPKMNGIELYDCLHAQQDLANTPAIIMSAYLPKEEVKKRNLVGLEKPFELDQLFSTIEQLIEHRG